uniref:Uncharacterized protein n=1 Tax=Anopheles albimanus TaxID=7167 RepID=A0A182FZP3_ANOAL
MFFWSRKTVPFPNEPERVGALPLAMRVQMVLGISGTPKDRYRFAPPILCFIVINVIPKVFFKYVNLQSTILGMAEFCFQLNALIGVALLMVKNEELKLLMKQLEEFAANGFRHSPPNIILHLEFNQMHIHKHAIGICKMLFYAVNFFNVMPIVSSLWTYYYFRHHQNTTFEFSIPIEMNFYNWDIKNSVVKYTFFEVLINGINYLIAVSVALKSVTVYSLSKYCILYFQLVGLELETLAQDSSDWPQQLKSIVRKHQTAHDCAKLLETVTAPLLLLQLSLCVAMCSIMLLFFTISNGFGTQFMNLFILFVVTITESFMYCILGDQLSSEGLRVAQTVYGSFSWENVSASMMKQLQFMMLQAQQPIGLTGGKFFFLSVEQFGKIIKTTYSIFLVLKDAI